MRYRTSSGLGASYQINKRRLKEYLLKVQTVPGGSTWKCVSCDQSQPSGSTVVKQGKRIYCSLCIQKEVISED